VKKAPIIGIFGGGQLGRMSILAGRRLGLHFRVFEPKRGSTAAKVADEVVIGPYEDLQLVRQFATGLDVVTVEFENVPAAAMRCAAEVTAVRPSAQVLEIAQHRQREKTWLRDHGFPCAPFRVIEARSALEVALQALGLPAVLKTAAFGYDGKGQVKLTSADPATLDQAWAALGGQTAVLEAWIPHQGEVSVIGARSPTGEVAFYPLAENLHRNHILHQTIVPARVPAALEEEAQSLARALFEKIESGRTFGDRVVHRPRRSPLGQRTGAPAPQLGPSHLGRQRHFPVRATRASGPGLAPGFDRGRAAGGDDQPIGRSVAGPGA
jgi:5-(carboxyamino)imidazole ribonucleotide synthase